MVSPRAPVTEPDSARRFPALPKPSLRREQTLQYSYTLAGKPSTPDCIAGAGSERGTFSPPWEGSEEMWVPHRKPQAALSLCIQNFPLPHASIFMHAPHHVLSPREHRSCAEPGPALGLLCPDENPTELLQGGLPQPSHNWESHMASRDFICIC